MTTAVRPGVYMQLRRKAILCLCQDSNMLQVRRMLLEHFGYDVLPTSSVEDAKRMLSTRCPDMFLMDNNDPGVDFEELAQHVKTLCPHVITVMLSPFYAARKSGRDGIDRVVAKDDGPDALLSQIHELLESNP